MRLPDDPDLLTPELRLQEVAAILARGVLRLRVRAALACNQPGQLDPENTAENPPGSA